MNDTAGDGAMETAWASTAEAVVRAFGVEPERGLNDAEARARRGRFGANVIEARSERSLVSILLAQFRSIVVLLLVGAGGLALLMQDYAEAIAILAVTLINAAIGFATEWRATRSMEALERFARVDATVIRSGETHRRPAADLVPGDIVRLDAGDTVPADLRLLSVTGLTINESSLTGESLPVAKHVDPLPVAAPVLDRENMAFKGTAVTRGNADGVVVATGKETEFGRIFEQVRTAAPQQTPLEKRLDRLGGRLVKVVLVVAVLLAIAGVVTGRDLSLSIEVAIALAVAAIPEGLPIVATLALARGMWRMAQRNALITRLSAVETLGATSVILTDKTGTLTENRMHATEAALAGRVLILDAEPDASIEALRDRLLLIASLCSSATLDPDDEGDTVSAGDPTEIALLEAAARFGIWRRTSLAQFPQCGGEPFDAERKRMATWHRTEGGILVAVKGAPEAIVPLCVSARGPDADVPLDDAGRTAWLELAEGFGRDGLRTLALAEKSETGASPDSYADLVLLGLLSLEDPAREGVDDAIRACRAAGIGVVMATGDHPATALSIAEDIGLAEAGSRDPVLVGDELDGLLGDNRGPLLREARVFARVTPEQKLRLIELHQNAGAVVAMTGDGVNDAPALSKADIGVAMGIRGTDAAREASAMVLQDDEFRTIVAAVEQGRAIFQNIRKFVVYLLSCNLSEVLVVSLATVAGGPLPLLPLQILFLNLVTDVFPALALGMGEGSPGLMRHRPRPASERILMQRHWLEIVLHAAVIALTVLAAMATAVFALGFEPAAAVTISFCTLAFAQLWHVMNMREPDSRWLRNEISANPWVWVAVALCILLVLAAVYVPVLAAVLGLRAPGIAGWTLIAGASLVPLATGRLIQRFVAARDFPDAPRGGRPRDGA